MLTLNDTDRALLARKGISEEQLEQQLQRFAKGFPYLDIKAAASTEKGIYMPTAEEQAAYLAGWEDYLATPGHEVVKFVPASGGSSRMFKDLFAFLEAPYDVPTTKFEQDFFAGLSRAAFCPALDEACRKLYGRDIAALVSSGGYKNVVRALLGTEGLNYGALPKSLLLFHATPSGARTPLEEHLAEGAAYARNHDGRVAVHFTVSPEHRALFAERAKTKAEEMGRELGVTFQISFSEQNPSTDTIAATETGEPFRKPDGTLLFRPGGHGALIENLAELPADIVFIKNIDNVTTTARRNDTIRCKKLLAGILVSLQEQIFSYLRRLDSGRYHMADLIEMLYFVQNRLCCKNPSTKLLEDTEMAVYLRRKLNRPIRVCGMVLGKGEPGGGPFLAFNPDGTFSPQILESAQIDMADPAKKALFEQGTHFNPVDLVCGLKDYRGHAFDLKNYVDPQTGFIAHKSCDGRPLQALELPGLWNGAMSDWNTVFVEVPSSTFTPVKTVLDLLRPAHWG